MCPHQIGQIFDQERDPRVSRSVSAAVRPPSPALRTAWVVFAASLAFLTSGPRYLPRASPQKTGQVQGSIGRPKNAMWWGGGPPTPLLPLIRMGVTRHPPPPFYRSLLRCQSNLNQNTNFNIGIHPVFDPWASREFFRCLWSSPDLVFFLGVTKCASSFFYVFTAQTQILRSAKLYWRGRFFQVFKNLK